MDELPARYRRALLSEEAIDLIQVSLLPPSLLLVPPPLRAMAIPRLTSTHISRFLVYRWVVLWIISAPRNNGLALEAV